ncbi:hydrogenase maturation protease [Peterkaempfera sp. SMS 1(5)a]|uniref:hydrogenase maturation protease n=1 Tax=Peterkaempfera podocarpi TaxID=3232308 RepID=UPI00366BE9BE
MTGQQTSEEQPAGRTVRVGGTEVGRGSRVRLRPHAHADILDLALTGRTAEVVGVEEDYDGRLHLAVVLDDDPGRDLGTAGKIGHRFFFAPDEVEVLGPEPAGVLPAAPRILVAGIGNIFLGDDAFGPEVAAALLERRLPGGVRVADFGIRGMDLAYALVDGCDAAVLVDAAPRGCEPGSLHVIEPDLDAAADAAPEAHAMDPVRVLALAHRLGDGRLPRVLVVGCEPSHCPTGDEPEPEPGLSPAVRAAVGPAVSLVERVVGDLLAELGHREPVAQPVLAQEGGVR